MGVRDWTNYHAFTDVDRAVLRATDELLLDKKISPTTWEDCVRLLDADEPLMIDLVATITMWNMVSLQVNALEIQLDTFLAPWPPDGVGPDSASERPVA
jgi:hypothetical protein